ncbi:hypothetical protein ElyMa_002384500 [Elysia marginata]|uniref:Uncharacterized protein n=1 Tax=Elysia marginata TaxID=1093978 RepID=A0AAV4GD55_9GAST|nr:hypothetical protein ElyMa_002384500 [Elysia marginata]
MFYARHLSAIIGFLRRLSLTQLPEGDTEQMTESRPESLPELPTSARKHPGSDIKVSKSPKPHRAVRGHAGQHINGRSNLGPPLIPLDVTHQNGPVAKEIKSSGGKKPGKKMVTLAQTYAGPLDCVGDLDLETRQTSRKADEMCGSDTSGSPSGDSAVSMDQLSTTCLGAEVTVKPRPQLEASRTYHIFPTETVAKEAGLPGAPPIRLWSPGKSSSTALNRFNGDGGTALRSSGKEMTAAGASHLFDPGLGSPFRTSPRLTRPRTEEGRARSTVEFITKDFVARHKINLCPDWNRGGGATSISNSVAGGASTGLKANTIQPDLPPTFQLKGVSTQPRLATGGGAGAVTRRKRGLSKTATGRSKRDSGAGLQLESIDRKSWSASTTDTTTSSGKGTNQSSQARTRGDLAAAGSINRQQGGITPPSLGPVPYFKFWNSSIPPKSRESRRAGGRRDRGLRAGAGLESSELNLAQLAQIVLADETGRQERGFAQNALKVLEEQQRLENSLSRQQQQQQQDGVAAQGGTGQDSIASGVRPALFVPTWLLPHFSVDAAHTPAVLHVCIGSSNKLNSICYSTVLKISRVCVVFGVKGLVLAKAWPFLALT